MNEVEVIVVANGCTDNTREYVEYLGDLCTLVWSDEPLGFAKATNLGLKASKGEYLLLLNNDTVVQHKRWLDLLLVPFSDPKMGVVGPIMHTEVGIDFIIGFCLMTTRQMIETEVGYLDESFEIGGMEDVDFCHRVKLSGYKIATTDGQRRSNFPIIHYGERTVWNLDIGREAWEVNFKKNQEKLAKKWGLLTDQEKMKLGNNYERAVFGKNDPILHREHARYSWVKDNVVGNKILEIGCSSGYGTRYLNHIKDLNYLGIDKDEAIIKLATEQFGTDSIKFQVEDVVKKFLFGIVEEKWDTIIILECVEHIEYGKELVQKLKEHCTCLLASVPYDEPKGYWGGHHVMHNLKEFDFLGFNYKYINYAGVLLNEPDLNFSHFVDGVNKNENLMLLKWEKDKLNTAPQDYKQKLEEGVTVTVSTKGRYLTTLPLTLLSIAQQTSSPKKLMIFDDNEKPEDLREIETYRNIFSMLIDKGIQWEVIYGEKKGQVANHQKALELVTTEFIYRIDDDCVLEANVLEELLKFMKDEKVGAVGGLVLDPKFGLKESVSASNKIEDIYLGMNQQWFKQKYPEAINVGHLYSTFLFRKEAATHGYNLELSPKGHREETLLTYEMKRNGWLLYIDPTVKIWHFQNSQGGIRSDRSNERFLFEHDEKIFQKKLQKWGVKLNKHKFFVLDCGLGDSLVFSKLIPEIKEKYKEYQLIFAVCYPEAFEEHNVKQISIGEAQFMLGEGVNNFNIYRWMVDNKWTKSLEEAFRTMYL
jgi:GT2 family glycosyltransferase